MNSKAKEPLFHIVKRDALPWQRGLRIRLLAILLALVVCGILTTIFTGINPVQVYVSIFMGAFGTARKTWITFQNVAEHYDNGSIEVNGLSLVAQCGNIRVFVGPSGCGKPPCCG